MTPSPANGLVALAIQSGTGTSSSSQPAWLTAPFPSIGTQFVDGTVTWMIVGSMPGNWSTIIQLPVDNDEPLAFPQVIPEQTIADELAWLNLNVGLLSANNTWTGTNTFKGPVHLLGQVTNVDNAEIELTNGGFIQFNAPYGGDSGTQLPIYWSENPTSFSRLWLWAAQVSSATKAYVYADGNPGGNAHFGLTFGINANWFSSAWHQPDTGHGSMIFVFSDNTFDMSYWPAGTAASSIFGLLTIVGAMQEAFFTGAWGATDVSPRRQIYVSGGPEAPIAPTVSTALSSMISAVSVAAGSNESDGAIHFTTTGSGGVTAGDYTIFKVLNNGTGGSNRKPISVILFAGDGSGYFIPGNGSPGSFSTAVVNPWSNPITGGWEFHIGVGTGTFVPVANNYVIYYHAVY